MTVKDLVDALSNKDFNSKVIISINGDYGNSITSVIEETWSTIWNEKFGVFVEQRATTDSLNHL